MSFLDHLQPPTTPDVWVVPDDPPEDEELGWPDLSGLEPRPPT